MAFKASTATQAQALLQIMQIAVWIKQLAQNASTTLQAGNVTSDQIFQLTENLRSQLAQLDAAAAVPGLSAYAQAQFNDPAYNVATEYSAMRAAVVSVISWVVSNFPKGVGGFLQSHTITAEGLRVSATFTPAQTAGLVTALNALTASIN